MSRDNPPGAPTSRARPAESVLVIEDDPIVRISIASYFSALGFGVVEAATCEEGERAFRSDLPDAVLLDHGLPDGEGLDLLTRLHTADPSVPILILTAHGSIDIAVRAIKEGAEQFFVKPADLGALAVVVRRLLDNRRNRSARLAGRARDARRATDPFLGSSPAIARLREMSQRLLTSRSPVLILGETGTGKGVLARWIHQNGPRADETFVDLNCAGLSREFLETELFGHEKGAFTGAAASKQGLFEVAHRGTLFLDEIGDVDPMVQPKLLKVIEEQQFRRLGDVRDRRVDVRLVAATHSDIEHNAAFRRDLFYRINTLPLRVPPLRDRREDIATIAETLLARIGVDLGRGVLSFNAEALARLEAYPWPGNIREMRSIVERAVLLLDPGETELTASGLDEVLGRAPVPSARRLTLVEVEKGHIDRILREERGDVAAAASVLGLSRSSLYERMKKYDISPPRTKR
jgi:DNA-binding NtrC family response regulator